MKPNNDKWKITRRLPHIVFIWLVSVGADAGVLETGEQVSFGLYQGVEYIQYRGRFVGETSQGQFRVPFEIIAPADPGRNNGTVVVEPPHFTLGLPGREQVLGNKLLFNRGFAHASVGFAVTGLNLLDPDAVDLVIAGVPAMPNAFPFARDVEILHQFAEALSHDPFAFDILGRIEHRYAFGVSQSAEAIYELQYGPGASSLFDLTVLHVPVWRPPFADPRTLATLPEEFQPLNGVGKVMLISSEGDFFFSESLQLRNSVRGPSANSSYRLYEVAGGPHLFQPLPLNPLDISPVTRAAFIKGNRWVKHGRKPPRSLLIESAPDGQIDPVHGFETGVARDLDGNAKGGIQFPDVRVGRALFIASVPAPLPPPAPPGLVGLFGAWVDLACAPRPGSGSLEPRFANHGGYVRGVWRQSLRLLIKGYLLPEDARQIVRGALKSDVGTPGSCSPN